MDPALLHLRIGDIRLQIHTLVRELNTASKKVKNREAKDQISFACGALKQASDELHDAQNELYTSDVQDALKKLKEA